MLKSLSFNPWSPLNFCQGGNFFFDFSKIWSGISYHLEQLWTKSLSSFSKIWQISFATFDMQVKIAVSPTISELFKLKVSKFTFLRRGHGNGSKQRGV